MAKKPSHTKVEDSRLPIKARVTLKTALHIEASWYLPKLGKCLHKTIRSSQASLYECFLQNQQLGGRRGIPVTLGMHHLRAFLRVQQQQGRSCGIVFLDLKEAFYRVFRPLALQSDWTDADIAGVASRLGLPSSIIEELYAHLQDPCALTQAGLPPFLRNCITAIHTDTWFVVEGQSTDICRTTAGSRPGDCFADTVFGFLWARVLRSLEEQFVALDLLEHLPVMETFDPFHPTAPWEADTRAFLGMCWMDDLAIPVAADTAQALVHKLGILTGLLLDQCVSFAMTPNLAAGKTELLLALRGAGSRRLRQQFHGAHGGRLFPIAGEHGGYSVRVVTRYRHLGGVIHHNGDQRQEARQRLGQAHQTFTKQRRLLFCNRALPLHTRTQLFETLVGSALTYGSESWILRTQKDKHQVHVGITRLYMRLLKTGPADHLTDEEIFQQLLLPAPTVLLRRARLRYLGTLFQCGLSAEWGLLSIDQEWLQLLCDDLRWMWQQLLSSTVLGDPASHFPQWRYLIQYHAGYWKRLVNRATAHAVRQAANRTLVAAFHRRVFALLESTGTLCSPAPMYHKKPSSLAVFGCMHCGLGCRSRGGKAHISFENMESKTLSDGFSNRRGVLVA